MTNELSLLLLPDELVDLIIRHLQPKKPSNGVYTPEAIEASIRNLRNLAATCRMLHGHVWSNSFLPLHLAISEPAEQFMQRVRLSPEMHELEKKLKKQIVALKLRASSMAILIPAAVALLTAAFTLSELPANQQLVMIFVGCACITLGIGVLPVMTLMQCREVTWAQHAINDFIDNARFDPRFMAPDTAGHWLLAKFLALETPETFYTEPAASDDPAELAIICRAQALRAQALAQVATPCLATAAMLDIPGEEDANERTSLLSHRRN